VNQRVKPRNGASGSNLADMGRDAVRDLLRGGGSTPEPVLADGEEATLKACGVGVAMLPGYRRAPHSLIDFVVNVGTIRGRPTHRAASPVEGRSVAGYGPTDGAEAS
jgi:hypothetical protein